MAADIKHAVGTADQLTDDLNLGQRSSNQGDESPRSSLSSEFANNKIATAPASPVTPELSFAPPSCLKTPTTPSSYVTATAGSSGSFNSAAFLANMQRTTTPTKTQTATTPTTQSTNVNSGHQSVLWNLPNDQQHHDNEHSTTNDTKVIENPSGQQQQQLENQKAKKFNKGFGIVNIGKNVAKWVVLKLFLIR